jgi:imidazolonepropionase-like amidohydrolase
MGDLEEDQLIEFQIRSELEDVVETLRSATSINADIIGRPDLGRIAEEAQADLVIFDGNPLDDPSLLWKGQRQVIQAGEVLNA